MKASDISRARCVVPLAFALGLAACHSEPSVEERAATSKALIDRYCTDCHNDAERTGELTLEGLALTDVGEHAAVWESVVRKLRGRMMPPAGEPLPEGAATDELVAYLEEQLDRNAAANPEPGREVAAPAEPHGVRQRDPRPARARHRRERVPAERQRSLRLRQHRRRARHRSVVDGPLPLGRVEDHERRDGRLGVGAVGRDVSRSAGSLATRSRRRPAARHARRHARHPLLPRRRRVPHQAEALAQHGRRRARHGDAARPRGEPRRRAALADALRRPRGRGAGADVPRQDRGRDRPPLRDCRQGDCRRARCRRRVREEELGVAAGCTAGVPA